MPLRSASDSDPKSVSETPQKDREAATSTHPDPGGAPVRVNKPSSDTTGGSPKIRKTRKPDREIYQPGGRRTRGCKDSGPSVEAEPMSKGLVQGEDVIDRGKTPERFKKTSEEDTKEKEKRRKESRKGTHPAVSPSDQTGVEIIYDELRKLNVSNSGVDPEKNKAKEGKVKKMSREGPENITAGGEDQRSREKGKRRSRGGRERGTKQPVKTAEEEEEGHRSRQDAQNEAKDKGSHPKKGNAERRRASDGTEASRTNFTSKRYSKSEIRRPRNRTYSTSSASSANSTNGRERWTEAGFRESERDGGGAQVPKSHGKMNPIRQKKRRNVSSTDSLEDNETTERRNEKSTLMSAKGRSGGNTQGGILRISLNKQSRTLEDPKKHKDPGPRGRGRGILILPPTSTEPGPRLMSSRGGAVQVRGRGGRGGSTRRLWDPNNPDKKPALAGSPQSLNSPHQQPLYLQHQGGYGPLYFQDTDDEVVGSPPMCQGEHFTSQHAAAAMAFYKYQNSDNPYRYRVPSGAPSTPPCFTYSYPYQIPGSNGMYPGPAVPSFYGVYAHGGQGYPPTGLSSSPEETEVQTRGELSKILRVADGQEVQLSNLLSRERLSCDGMDKMAQLR